MASHSLEQAQEGKIDHYLLSQGYVTRKCVASYLGSILPSTTPAHNKKIVHLKNCKHHNKPKVPLLLRHM